MGKVRQLCKEMICGLVMWCVVILVPLMIVSESRVAVFFGVVVGGLVSVIVVFHMYRHLDIALDMDAKRAKGHMQFAVIQRFIIMAVVLGVSMVYYSWIHPIGVVFGLFGIKITALFYPVYHKLFEKRYAGRNH